MVKRLSPLMRVVIVMGAERPRQALARTVFQIHAASYDLARVALVGFTFEDPQRKLIVFLSIRSGANDRGQVGREFLWIDSYNGSAPGSNPSMRSP